MVIAVLMSVAALYLGRQFFVPIAMALLFHALLRRPVRLLESFHVPTWLGALIVVVGCLGLVGVAGWALSDPVSNWFHDAPQQIAQAQHKLRSLGRPMQQIAQAASGDSAAANAKPDARPRREPAAPAAAPPGVVTQALGTTVLILGATAEVVLLLYLLLSSGDLFLRKLMNVVQGRESKRAALDVLHLAEGVVARYLIFTVVISAGQGAAVALVMWAMGMPNPLMWALLTTVLELIPYLGAAAMVILLTVSALTAFPTVGHALLAPLAYLAISTIQNNVVTPLVFNSRLKLNAVAVLIGVVFWYFIWGIAGAFLAIPILAMAKALADEIPQLAPLGEFLGE